MLVSMSGICRMKYTYNVFELLEEFSKLGSTVRSAEAKEALDSSSSKKFSQILLVES